MVTAVELRDPVLTASFRDPAGRLFSIGDRIIRVIYDEMGAADLRAFLSSKLAQDLTADGRLVGTKILEPAEVTELVGRSQVAHLLNGHTPRMVVQHERIEFRSFPYEWAPEMLYEAGCLTLDLAKAALADGYGLKDATPYNVLYRGSDPVFIDLLSFEKRHPLDPTWLPYAQFCRTFLMPLLANKYFGVSIAQTLGTHRDGLEPEEVYRLFGGLRRMVPPVLTLVSIPTWLGGKRHQKRDDGKLYEKKRLNNPEKAKFILESLLRTLRSSLDDLAPKSKKASAWSDYMESNNNYTREHFDQKQKFVETALAEFKPKRVLDVGANTGHFSHMAAKSGAHVVAVDYDPVVVGDVWRGARGARENVLPLVVNVAWPTPAIGWRNKECPAFLDRARGAFDGILMLAVIHHLLVSERIPLSDILDLAAELTTDLLIIEFISPDDSMFKRISRGREHLFAGLNPEVFETECKRHYEIVQKQHVEGTTRWLYALRRIHR